MEDIETEEDLRNAQREVNVWLENIFSPHSVPQYEINKHSTSTLYHLMKRNQEIDRLTKINIDDITRKTEEYKIENNYNQKLLEEIGLSKSSLSQSGLSCLRTLSELAVSLKQKNCNLSSYLLAMSDLSNKIEKKRSELREEQIEKQKLQTKLESVSDEKKSLKRYFEELEQKAVVQRPLTDKRKKETLFLKEKTKEYDTMIQNLQDVISQVGLSDDIRHENLEQLSEEFNEIRGQINVLKTRLSSFHSLPPDMSLARVKIEEAKQNLALLEKELYTDLETLNL